MRQPARKYLTSRHFGRERALKGLGVTGCPDLRHRLCHPLWVDSDQGARSGRGSSVGGMMLLKASNGVDMMLYRALEIGTDGPQRVGLADVPMLAERV